MPKATRRTGSVTPKPSASVPDNLMADARFRLMVDKWHHHLNYASGTLVLGYGRSGLTAGQLRELEQMLRGVADQMASSLSD